MIGNILAADSFIREHRGKAAGTILDLVETEFTPSHSLEERYKIMAAALRVLKGDVMTAHQRRTIIGLRNKWKINQDLAYVPANSTIDYLPT